MRGSAPSYLLDSYEAERHPVGADVLRLTDVFNQLVHIARKMGDPILERAVDFVLADEITHVRMGSKWLTRLTEGDPERRKKAIAFQETIDERFNLGGVRQDGDHDVVLISIATEARQLGGFTDEEIDRLIKTTQRSQVY